MSNKLFLGVATEEVTPKIGCALYGYCPNWFSESVNDDLTVTAYYFTQGDTNALMLGTTVASINNALFDKIFGAIEDKFGISRNNCIIHATHTHSAPNISGSEGWGDMDYEYFDEIFFPGIMKAVERAINGATPVTIGISQGESLVGINRRELTIDNRITFGQNPWGSFDPKMTVISFANEENKTVANIIHYGAHCTASGKNREISRDWAGVMVDYVEALSGGVTAFFNGPEGDVGPRMINGTTEGRRTVKDAMQLGGYAAQDAARIYKGAKVFKEAKLSVSTKTIMIPYKPRVSYEFAKAEVAKFGDNVVNIEAQSKAYYEKIVKSYDDGCADLEGFEFKQTVICLGDVAFVSFPYEIFSEIGLRIQKHSKIPYTLSLSNANGCEGYFATEDQLCRGGYEIKMNKTAHIQEYVDNGDWYMITETLEHLSELK